jgi:hypothetical protein
MVKWRGFGLGLMRNTIGYCAVDAVELIAELPKALMKIGRSLDDADLAHNCDIGDAVDNRQQQWILINQGSGGAL